MLDQVLVVFGVYAAFQSTISVVILKKIMRNSEILNNGLSHKVERIERRIFKDEY